MDDFVKEARQGVLEERVSGERAEELFKRAPVPLDPAIYKGEMRSYKPRDTIDYQNPKELLDQMQRQSPSIDDVVGEYTGVHAEQYRFEEVALQYLQGDAQELYGFLQEEGREFYDITRVGTADLGDAVAGVARYGNEAALLGNERFDERVSQLASRYDVPRELAVRYVLDHEFVHTSQKGMGYDDEIVLEVDVENTLKRFYSEMAGKYEGSPLAESYEQLHSIASQRAGEVVRNYGGFGAESSSMALGGKSSYS